MNPLKVKKGPILLPLALLVLALAGYTLLHFRGVSAADSLTLGQQYLNELNYGGAVAAFTRAIELDPNSTHARVGLAQAYAGTENYDFAQQVLEEMVYTQRPDEDATAAMIELLRESGQLSQAAELAQTLIDATDDEDYYDLRGELLAQLYARPRSLAVGADQTLLLQGGQVLGRGGNALGQLGLDPLSVSEAGLAVSAQFPGQAVKVACAGRASFVVDQEGRLWAAGENRWGQMGAGYAATVPQGGWFSVQCPGPVADVAGTTGRLLVLLTDGSLWTVGAGSEQTLSRLSRFPVVVEIAADQNRAAVLTASGVLYLSDSRTPDQWTPAARDVCSFTLSDGALCWVGQGNALHTDGGSSFSAPETWYSDGGVRADRAVDRFACLSGLALFTSSGGRLYRLPGDGTVEEVACPGLVTNLYAQGGVLVMEYGAGSAQYWSPDAAAPAPLEQF